MVIKERPFYHYFDWLLVLAPVVLAAIGIVMIYNTTSTTPGLDTSDLLHDITFRQIVYAVAGVIVIFSLSAVDYHIYATLRWPIYVATIALLGIVLVIGQITHGAQRWIDLSLFQLQPSELSKMLIVIVLAKFLADHERQISQWRTLLISLGLVGLPMALVYFEPDLGTALILGFIWLVMVVAAGMSWKQIALLAVLALILLPVIWLTLQPYQRDRVMSFLNPGADPSGSGYNLIQARIAIGSGGIWGRGVGFGTQSQLRFLRIRHTDFIFSVIGEELGLWGGIFFFVVFAFIILRLLRASLIAHSTYGRLIALGFAAALFFQSFVNLGMNLGLMPVTGIPLPFVSSGGSSLITFMMMVGIVESILAHDKVVNLRSAPLDKKKQDLPRTPQYGEVWAYK
jgi:rod shape determining protein RodA